MKHVTKIKYEAMETDNLCAVYNQSTGNLIMNTSCEDHEGKAIVLRLMDKNQREVSEKDLKIIESFVSTLLQEETE